MEAIDMQIVPKGEETLVYEGEKILEREIIDMWSFFFLFFFHSLVFLSLSRFLSLALLLFHTFIRINERVKRRRELIRI